jgi:hypothetical protein
MGVLLFVLLFFAMIRGFVELAGPTDDESQRDAPPPIAVLGPSDAEIDVEVAKVFGAGTDIAAVRAADPAFADQLRLAIRNARDNGGALAFVRHKALQTGEIAPFDALVTLAELKLMWRQAALGSSDQCRNIMAGDFRSLPITFEGAQAEREARLLRRLLDAGLLNYKGRARGGGSFEIPGWAVEQAVKRSGMGDATFMLALQNPDSPERCRAERSLLETVLKQPGRVSADLLRAL